MSALSTKSELNGLFGLHGLHMAVWLNLELKLSNIKHVVVTKDAKEIENLFDFSYLVKLACLMLPNFTEISSGPE